MSDPSSLLCSNSDTWLESLQAVERFYILRDMFKTESGRIILEEVIAESWKHRIKPTVRRMVAILPMLPDTVFWEMPKMKRLVTFFALRTKKLSPCKFVDFLEELLNIPGIDDDLKFLQWIFSSKENCQRAFRIVKRKRNS